MDQDTSLSAERKKEQELFFALMESVDLSAFPLHLEITYEIEPMFEDWLSLAVIMKVPDRATGELISVMGRPRRFTKFDRDFMLLGMYEALAEAVTHELRESIKVAGDRVFDPHAGSLLLKPRPRMPRTGYMAQSEAAEKMSARLFFPDNCLRCGRAATLLRSDGRGGGLLKCETCNTEWTMER